MTSGNGSLGNFASGGNANGSQSRVQSGTSMAAMTVNKMAPTETSIMAAEMSTPPAGTSAVMDGKATAGGSIGVKANEQDTISIIGGQVSGGVVGAGASIAILTVADNVAAQADGTLKAGGNINVNATLNENISLIDIDGAVGFVGIGAAVAVITDNSLTQASLGSVTGAGAVSVSANSNRALNETTGQLSIGAAAAGASFTWITVGGGTNASVDGGVTLSSISSLSVTAQSTIKPARRYRCHFRRHRRVQRQFLVRQRDPRGAGLYRPEFACHGQRRGFGDREQHDHRRSRHVRRQRRRARGWRVADRRDGRPECRRSAR